MSLAFLIRRHERQRDVTALPSDATTTGSGTPSMRMRLLDWLLRRAGALGVADDRLSRELAAHAETRCKLEALQRYEIALRRSNVTIFTQDRELRYTSVTDPVFGHGVDGIVGRTDEEVLTAGSRSTIVEMKRNCLLSGQPRNGEFAVGDGATLRWYDLHVEPLRDTAGATVGLTCVAVDVTERKESDAQARMLLRELTHRSKNLLAIIQAMARQTARHAGSLEGFLEQFAARLQALATSHDLLVQGSWHGVSLHELARSQLDLYAERPQQQISINGPGVILRPEVAQDLGLALHELAANATRYGALSAPEGRVSITWRRLSPSEGPGVELVWSETGGPTVPPPIRRGFGSLAIERNLARAIDGDVALAFASDGVTCRIVIPETRLSSAP
jgi:PAS domain S-box-containing protein